MKQETFKRPTSLVDGMRATSVLPEKETPLESCLNEGEGCFKDCFYYTDSCFRKDCINKEKRYESTYRKIQIMVRAISNR